MVNQKKTLREYIKPNIIIETKLGKINSIKPIGEGGNGLVFSGKLYNFEIALKFLVNSDQKKLERFKAEYLFTNFLPANDYIAKTLFYDEIEIKDISFPVIVMKKYDDKLKRNKDKVPSLQELERIFYFLLNSLDFIHKEGIIHRDIKPQNILTNGDNFVLCDFGIANYDPDIFKEKKFETKKGERLGNYSFSAPEQASGAKPHKTMDIYALGQICQWYATNNIHKGTSRDHIFDYIKGTELIDEIIDKCLSNNPKDRFQNIEEIRQRYPDDLGEALPPEEKKRRSDISKLKELFSVIHIPTLDLHIREAPGKIHDEVFHFYFFFDSVVGSTLFYFYDEKLKVLTENIHKSWDESLSYDFRYDPPSMQRYCVFINSSNMELADDDDWKSLVDAVNSLDTNLKELVHYVRENYLEIDIEELSRKAWDDYLKFQKDRS